MIEFLVTERLVEHRDNWDLPFQVAASGTNSESLTLLAEPTAMHMETVGRRCRRRARDLGRVGSYGGCIGRAGLRSPFDPDGERVRR
jgi:hypothetical protein